MSSIQIPRNMSTEKRTKSQRAEVSMPVARIERNLRNYSKSKRVSPLGAVYTAAVLDYLSVEVLELAGIAATQNKKKRIVPRHIMMAIENDPELKKLLSGVIFPDSGVMPNIHPNLLPPRSNKNVVVPPNDSVPYNSGTESPNQSM